MKGQLGSNNYKTDKLVGIQVRNWFKTSGYYAYYMIKEEQGVDYVLHELFDNRFKRGFWTQVLVPDFNFESANVFSKFGIQIPNTISFLVRMDIMEEERNRIKSELDTDEDFFNFPDEGDLIFLPLQNTLYRETKINELTQNQLADLLVSQEDSMRFLFEVTYVHDKEYIFNGRAWVYKLECKVYEKKFSDVFETDLEVVADKINQNPEPKPNYETPTENTESQPSYVDENLKNDIEDLLEFD